MIVDAIRSKAACVCRRGDRVPLGVPEKPFTVDGLVNLLLRRLPIGDPR